MYTVILDTVIYFPKSVTVKLFSKKTRTWTLDNYDAFLFHCRTFRHGKIKLTRFVRH